MYPLLLFITRIGAFRATIFGLGLGGSMKVFTIMIFRIGSRHFLGGGNNSSFEHLILHIFLFQMFNYVEVSNI